MRVLLVNAFHWLKGGVERTYLDESRWLGAAGHEVQHFATQHPRNLPSPTSAYFAPSADFGEGAPLLAQLGSLPSALWSAPAEQGMERLIAHGRPDVAHVHAPSRYLSPSIFAPLERAGVPVVMTLHDFKPWCTNRILMAHGRICERCKGGHHWHAATTGCVQGSHLKSAFAAFEAYLHDHMHAYRSVRRWIAPSRFVREKAIEWGVPAERVQVVSHGVEPMAMGAMGFEAPPRFALFAGRLSLEKGVKLLPEIARAIAPVPLWVAGEGPLAEWLRAKAPETLRMLGHLEDGVLAALRARASVFVAPSLFVEHFGYSVAEALLEGRPVVAARIGALPELVEHEVTGLLATPGDAAEHATMVKRALEDPAAAAWGAAGRARVKELADPADHVRRLVGIYEALLRL
ncbi:MAG: glycosyltransferase [Candidatus Eisenbacteria bacterium]